MEEFLANTATAGLTGTAVICGVCALYAWLIFVMIRFHIDAGELGPGQVHV